MRSMWRGSISFGLVNVPVRLFAAVESHDVPLHQVHDADGGRIRYERRCEVCGQIVSYHNINRAYDDGERTVVLTDKDIAALPAEHSRDINIVQFVPANQIDPMMFDHAYFLQPEKSAIKAYALLCRTLEDTDRLAIASFALRQRTRLAALRVREGTLLVQTLLWPDELRAIPEPEAPTKVTAAELEMSNQLVEAYSADFAPDTFTDEYQAELQTLIAAKLDHGDSLDTAATFGEQPDEESGVVVDLMAALKKSVEMSKESRASAKGKAKGRSTKERTAKKERTAS